MNLQKFYKNKKILITGHTGFKGSWLSIWLLRLGAEVTGYALDPYTPKDNFVLASLSEKMNDIKGDIRDFKNLNSVIETYKPEIRDAHKIYPKNSLIFFNIKSISSLIIPGQTPIQNVEFIIISEFGNIL